MGIYRGIAVAVLVACGIVRAAGSDVRDAVVAVVNKEVITQRELLERARPMLERIDAALPEAERERETMNVYRGALRAMVDDRLLVAEANRLLDSNEAFKRRIEERLNLRVEEERRKAGGEVPLRDSITAKGMTYAEYTERMRQDILREVVLYHFVMRDLTVAPSAVHEYYRSHLDEFREPEQVKYRQIFIRAGAVRSLERAREIAQELLGKARAGHDFAELARQNSEGPRARDGELYDFQRRGARPEPIDALLFSLPVGEAGGPAETEQGLTILKVEDRRAGRVKPFEEVQAQIESHLLGQKRLDRYESLIRRLEREHYVELVH